MGTLTSPLISIYAVHCSAHNISGLSTPGRTELTFSLEQSNQKLQQSQTALNAKATDLEKTLTDLQQAQLQIIQTEKMSSLGQLVAGTAHEINNPV